MFVVLETDQPNNVSGIVDCVHDRAALCVIRGAVPAAACSAVGERFLRTPDAIEREDGVTGRYLGASHFLKDPAVYLAESAKAAGALDRMFEGLVNPLAAALDALRGAGLALRVGAHGGRAFCPWALRAWGGVGRFQLEPHDDWPQLRHPAQSGLEIGRVGPTVCNLNLCLAVERDSDEDGALALWNLRPDDAFRAAHGVGATGYPYPEKALAGRTRVTVPIGPGDLYAINGRYVHAVTGAPRPGRRITMATMLGLLPDGGAIHWI